MAPVEPHNQNYVDSPDQYVNTPPMQLAIREVQTTASSPRFWIGLAAVVLLLAITAPFDTGSRFSFPVLLVYWGAIAVGSFFIALPTSVSVMAWCAQQRWMPSFAWLLGGIVAGLPVTVFVVLFNRLFFDIDPIADHGVVSFWVECTVIAVAILTLYRLVGSSYSKDQAMENQFSKQQVLVPTTELISDIPTTQSEIATTPFHRRLSPEIGEDIISLQAQDHYVDVTTSNGHEMILMRLSDAEQELKTLPGMRVHRSWWLALRHVVAIERQGDRVFARLDNEVQVPVSRARVSELRNHLAA